MTGLQPDPEKLPELIEEEISKTKRLIETYREMNKPVAPDVAIGRISRMDAINNKSITEASLRQAEDKLKSLEQVLTKVGTKDFGICLKCKKTIPLGRILIRPESQLCVNCAS
jgi:DnaK suppressor protein